MIKNSRMDSKGQLHQVDGKFVSKLGISKRGKVEDLLVTESTTDGTD